MARPLRAQGRPGTRVIPADWESSHAPAVERTFTAQVQVIDPHDSTPPALGADYSYSGGTAGTPVYTGGARVQVMNGQAAADVLGDQQQLTALYLVAIGRDATVPVGSVVTVTDSDDAHLSDGRRLIVRKVAGGSLRFERDLWCVDDMTWRPDDTVGDEEV